MRPELYEEVQLIVDVPAAELVVGDRAILIDYLEHPKGGEMGAVLELSQSLEREQYVVTVPVGAIAALTTQPLPEEAVCLNEASARASLFERILNISARFTGLSQQF